MDAGDWSVLCLGSSPGNQSDGSATIHDHTNFIENSAVSTVKRAQLVTFVFSACLRFQDFLSLFHPGADPGICKEGRGLS